MAVMDQKTLARLMAELGLNPEAGANLIAAQVAGTALAPVAQAKKSLFFNLYSVVVDQLWRLFYAAMALWVPQLFLRYASGHWLDERGLDDGVVRALGGRTRLVLTVTKGAGVPVSVAAGTVFFVSEVNPRRYQALVTTNPADGDVSFGVEVEAICPSGPAGELYSLGYNVPAGLTWGCETALPLLGISFVGPEYTRTGTDPETDEALRDRVYAKRALGSVNPGGVLYYLTLLKTLAGVAHVTHDGTDPLSATMTFSLYGAAGALDAGTQTAAQALFELKKMETDSGIIALATPELLALELSVKNGPVEVDLIQSVSDFFAAMDRGADFEEGPLYAHLFGQFVLAYPALTLRCSVNHAVLPAGRYWVPQTTVLALP